MKKNYYVSIFTSVSLLTTACSRDDNLDTKNSKSERQAFIIEEAFPDTPKELVTLRTRNITEWHSSRKSRQHLHFRRRYYFDTSTGR